MRKTLLLLFGLLLATEKMNAQTEQQVGEIVPLVTRIAHTESGSSAGSMPYPRTPILAPTVYLDDHTLILCTEFDEDIEVQLLDPDTMDDDEPTVVYSVNVPAGVQQVALPSTYTGEYGIRLVVGNWYFIGVINL